jgi:hypothetical protein
VLHLVAAATGAPGKRGRSEEEYLGQLGGPPTPEQAGQAVVDLVTDDAHDQDAYLLTTAGLRPLG